MKQIVFDMDGVLFATEALSDRLWKEMMEERGTPEMTAALQQCRGRNRTDTRAFFASHYPDFPYIAMETEKRNRMLAALDKDGMPTMKGAESLLQALQDAGWSVALATSTSRKTTMHHLELSGFTRYFSVIVTGDEIQHGKPNPEIYLTACKNCTANRKKPMLLRTLKTAEQVPVQQECECCLFLTKQSCRNRSSNGRKQYCRPSAKYKNGCWEHDNCKKLQ